MKITIRSAVCSQSPFARCSINESSICDGRRYTVAQSGVDKARPSRRAGVGDIQSGGMSPTREVTVQGKGCGVLQHGIVAGRCKGVTGKVAAVREKWHAWAGEACTNSIF